MKPFLAILLLLALAAPSLAAGPGDLQAPPTLVLRARMCHDIDSWGQPVHRVSRYPRNASKIILWWGVEPKPVRRVYEVRFYAGDQLQTICRAVIGKSGICGWAGIGPPSSGFRTGEWRAEMWQRDELLATQYFRVTEK